VSRDLSSPLLALLVALTAVGCASDSKVSPGSSPNHASWDTGEYWSEDDAWETSAGAEDADRDASWDGESGAYDGLRPADPEVLSDPEADGYAPDGILHVEFDLENAGELDFDHEPGLVLTVDHDDIELAEPAQWVDTLAAGESTRLQWWAAVGPMVRSGTTLSFTATVSARDCEAEGCPIPHTASVVITLE